MSVTFQQLTLPSAHHRPLAYPGRPFPPEVTDNRVLGDLEAQSINALFAAVLNTKIALPLVDNVCDYVLGDQPWLATDPTLHPEQQRPDLDIVQTGAWIPPDARPLPDDLKVFLDSSTPPVSVGFDSMPTGTSTDVARVVIEAIRAQGRRVLVGRGWAGLALIDERDDCFGVGEVNQQALFARVGGVVHHGGAGTTTTPPTESLSAMLRTALAPKTRARARTVTATIRTNGATVAARLLLDTINRESRQCPREPRGIVEPGKVPSLDHYQQSIHTTRWQRRRSLKRH